MHPALKTPLDLDLLDRSTIETSLLCPPEEDETRQEDRHDADIKTILDRHGYVPQYFDHRQPIYGDDIDMNLDLTEAHAAIEDAHAAYDRLPAKLKALYPDFSAFMTAVVNGNLNIEPREEAPQTPPEPAKPAPEGQSPEGTPPAS